MDINFKEWFNLSEEVGVFPNNKENTVEYGLRARILNFPMNTYLKSKFPQKAPLDLLSAWKSEIEFIEKHAARLPFKISLANLHRAKDELNNLMIDFHQKGGFLEPAISQSLPEPKNQQEFLDQIRQHMRNRKIPSSMFSKLDGYWRAFTDEYMYKFNLYINSYEYKDKWKIED